MSNFKCFTNLILLLTAEVIFGAAPMLQTAPQQPNEWFVIVLSRIQHCLAVCHEKAPQTGDLTLPKCHSAVEMTFKLLKSFLRWKLKLHSDKVHREWRQESSRILRDYIGTIVVHNNIGFLESSVQYRSKWFLFSSFAINITFTKFGLLYNCYLNPVQVAHYTQHPLFVEQLEVVQSKLWFCGHRPQWSLFLQSAATLEFMTGRNTLSKFVVAYQSTDRDVVTLKFNLKEQLLSGYDRFIFNLLKYSSTSTTLMYVMVRKDENVVVSVSNSSVQPGKPRVFDGPGILSPELKSTQGNYYRCITFQCTVMLKGTARDTIHHNITCYFATAKQVPNQNITLSGLSSMQFPNEMCSVQSGFFCMIGVHTQNLFIEISIIDFNMNGEDLLSEGTLLNVTTFLSVLLFE